MVATPALVRETHAFLTAPSAAEEGESGESIAARENSALEALCRWIRHDDSLLLGEPYRCNVQ